MNYQEKIGKIITENRLRLGLSQVQLAELAGTSQSAINRIENGKQNVSIDMVERLAEILKTPILSLNQNNTLSFRVEGGRELSGEITINTSKNAAMGLLCGALLNQGKTTLTNMPKIEEVSRIIEVLTSIGYKIIEDRSTIEIIPPKALKLDEIDLEAATRTRSILMFLGPLLHKYQNFKLPYSGGCSLGLRTITPHLQGLSPFGLEIDANKEPGFYHAKINKIDPHSTIKIILTERGDTVTENILLAASLHPGKTIVHNASNNYMVQDLAVFLQKLGVKIAGIGTTHLEIVGKTRINQDITYSPSEDPIEAMSFIAAALVTRSEMTIKRAPIDFLEIELEVLKTMNAEFEIGPEYPSRNNHTKLVDITIKKPANSLVAPPDKIHPMPYPGLNIDNLPFFSVIAASAEGRTLIHDWVYENRAVYITNLSALNAKIDLIDAHRVFVTGPTNWRPADITAPSALRPSVVLLIAMLAAPGTSILRNVYPIARGYEDLARRLNQLGAHVELLTDL